VACLKSGLELVASGDLQRHCDSPFCWRIVCRRRRVDLVDVLAVGIDTDVVDEGTAGTAGRCKAFRLYGPTVVEQLPKFRMSKVSTPFAWT